MKAGDASRYTISDGSASRADVGVGKLKKYISFINVYRSDPTPLLVPDRPPRFFSRTLRRRVLSGQACIQQKLVDLSSPSKSL